MLSDEQTNVIPSELKNRSQWVCWRYEKRGDKRTKAPIDSKSNGKLVYARTNDPATWDTFDAALATCEHHQLDGIGFCFAPDDGLTGIDLDHVIDSETGALTPDAQEVIRRFENSYIEISPSGEGLRIFCQGKPHRSGKNIGPNKWLEVYAHPSSRYLTTTGDHWPSSNLEVTEQQAALDWLHERFMAEQPTAASTEKKERTASQTPPDLDDAALIEKAHQASNGGEFSALWAGDTTRHNGDHSAADLALCNLLAFWTGNDHARIDRLFRLSGLMRAKWDEVHHADGRTYGQATIDAAITRTGETYSGRRTSGTASTGQGSAAPNTLLKLPTVSPCSHLSNSYRIQHYYKGKIWYALGIGWITWTGKFWRPDPTNEGAITIGFINKLSRFIAQESAEIAKQAGNEPEEDRRKAVMRDAEERMKWAAQSENERVISAGLKLSKHALLKEYSELNPDPWLFNVQNGTIDLRTGNLRPHDGKDLITFLSPVTYDPSALCPVWERFLSEVFSGDSEMVAFIQRAVGWTLTGVVKERALFFLYGDTGKNGKTTLVETVMKLVGNCGESSYGYGRKVGADTFMKSRNQEDNQRKAATLAGPRFICTSEVDEQHRLNEQLIKDITGGDTIEGRRLYQEAFTFKPQFKPWMYGNHKPEIRGTDDAIWSRVRMIPFDVSFAGREDHDLPDKLTAELSGILNWAVQGCLDWQRHGLNPPEKVNAATQAYREEMDAFGPFIAECCIVHPQNEVLANNLWKAYREWCTETGSEQRSQTKFGRYLTSKGFIAEKRSGMAWRTGLRLQDPVDPLSSTPF